MLILVQGGEVSKGGSYRSLSLLPKEGVGTILSSSTLLFGLTSITAGKITSYQKPKKHA